MPLEMRPACERCGANLAADAPACICSYECTFCPACAGAGCEVAGGGVAGCVLPCGADGVVAGRVAGVAGVVAGAGFGAGFETFSRIELPWPTALSVRRTIAKAHSINMTAHQVVAFERTFAAPRGPKAV